MNIKEAVKEKPNIILITTDTQRCDTLRCMGNLNAISPNIDKLASEGVMFNNAHSASPVCMPARCSLLTGLHTPIHGCIENGVNRHNNLVLFPDLLKAQGYTNIMVGKTHFGPIPESFDIQHTINGEKSTNSDDIYAQHIKKHGFSRSSSYPNPIPEELFMDSFLADTMIDDIKKVVSEGNNPFFAFCSFPSPHSPIDPPGKWACVYNNIPLPKINYCEGEVKNHPEHLKRLVGTLNPKENDEFKFDDICDCDKLKELYEAQGVTFNPDDPSHVDFVNKIRRLYYGLAAYCDAQIGKIIDFLDRSGLRKNTLVIFTSDHGQQYFDHGFNDKHNYYDSSWRVPLIISMPGTLPKGETRDFAILNDITATILAAAGTKCDTMQGFDLFTPLCSGERSPRRCAVGTLYKSAAVATKRWKLEYYFEEGSGRLFDRKNDPLEQNDIYNNPLYSDTRNELLKGLLTWRCDIADLKYLIDNTGGGGPVARRIAKHTLCMKGTDAEESLNRVAELVDGEIC